MCFEELETPKVRPGHVLVRTRAAALNALDLFVVGGLPGLDPEMPHILGSDGTGIVETVAEGTTRLKAGDRVMLNAVLSCGQCEFCVQGEDSMCIDLRLVGEHCHGTFAEYFLVPEGNLEKIPERVSFQEAAAFSLVFQTAWRMLKTRARIRPGEDVFIHGIGGGVSLAALGIAKMAGARVFVSSSSSEKLKRAAQLGADFGFDYGAGQASAGAALALVRPDGSTLSVAEDLQFPNGAVITPDGATLVVGETFGSRYCAFTVATDGTLSDRRIWAEVPGRMPDGCCLDTAGGIWFADAIRPEVVRVVEGGEITDAVEVPQRAFACMLGGDQGTTLFVITAPSDPQAGLRPGQGAVWAVEVDSQHAGLP